MAEDKADVQNKDTSGYHLVLHKEAISVSGEVGEDHGCFAHLANSTMY